MKKNDKIKIIVAIPSLCAGGAERVMSFVAQALSKEEFDTTLVVFGFKKDNVYPVEGIKEVYFNKPRVLTGIPKFYNFIRKEKPDIVFTAIGHLNTIGAYFTKFFKAKFVAREVNVLSVLQTFHKEPSYLENLFYSKRFSLIDAIVCQSQDMKNDLLKAPNLDEDKLTVINNPITDGFKTKVALNNNSKVHFITVARLVQQKGHARIFDAISKLDFDFRYTIIGDGNQKDLLVEQAKSLGIFDKLVFVDYTDKVNDYLHQSDIYLQGSYVEGFPNALLESLATGLPAVAFDAPGGINELIIEGENGFIAKDEATFIKHLNYYHQNNIPDPKVVSHTVFSRYNKDLIISKYEELFKSLID